MKNIDIRDVDINNLVDLTTVKIDETKPVPERVRSFMDQVKNPFCFKVGNIAVKVEYMDHGPTFQENLEEMLSML